MNIVYINTKNGPLYSFHRHDYKQSEEGLFIDGGFDYCRTNGIPITDTIRNQIKDIREQFEWTSNYDKDGNRIEPVKKLLKNLSSDHIVNILTHFINTAPNEVVIRIAYKSIQTILLEELLYRMNKITIKSNS